MSAEKVGSIFYDLDLDKKKFDKGVTSVSKSVGDLAKKATDSSKIIAGLLGGTVLALGAIAIGSAAELETLGVALNTVFEGNEQAAADAQERLIDFTSKTPFQLNEVLGAFIKLKNFGLDPSERALTAYGDTASALGKTLDQLVEAVADATTGEFERLKEFGIKTAVEGDKVAFTFKGVTTEIKNDATSIEGYLIGLGESNFAGGMEAQSKTLLGLVSTLKDNFGLFLASMAEQSGAMDLLRGAVEKINVAFADINEQIEAAGGLFEFLKLKYEENQSTIIILASVLASILAPALFAAAAGVLAVVAPLIPFAIAGVAVGLIVKKLADRFGGLGPLLEIVKDKMESLWAIIQPKLGPALGKLNDIIKNRIIPVFQRMWGFIQEKVLPALMGLKDIVVDTIIPALQSLWERVEERILPALQDLKATLVDDLVPALQELWDIVSPYLLPALGVLATVMGVQLYAAIFVIIEVIKVVINVITFLVKGFVWLQDVMINWISSSKDQLISWKDKNIEIFNAIVNAAKWLWEKIGDIFFKMGESTVMLILKFKEWKDRLVEYINGLIVGFKWWKDTISDLFNAVKDKAAELLQNIKDKFQDIKDKITDTIDKFIEIKEKIQDALSGVKDAITKPFIEAFDVIGDEVEKAKNNLDKINPFHRESPSLIDWIERGSGQITDTYSKMFDNLDDMSAKGRLNLTSTVSSLDSAVSKGDIAQPPINISLNPSGLIATSPGALRDISMQMIESANEVLQSRGKQQIGKTKLSENQNG